MGDISPGAIPAPSIGVPRSLDPHSGVVCGVTVSQAAAPSLLPEGTSRGSLTPGAWWERNRSVLARAGWERGVTLSAMPRPPSRCPKGPVAPRLPGAAGLA